MSVNEGNTIQYTVSTTKVADGTTLYWRTTGNVNYGLCGPSQLYNSNNGTIIVTNNQGIFNVSLNLNQYTDGTRNIGIGLSSTQWGPLIATTAQPIIINDTSKSPAAYSISYLIVGGGGHGGAGSACGGGGGGGGGVITGSVGVQPANTLTVTVGSGGGPSAGPPAAYLIGGSSSISAPNQPGIPGFTTKTALGGGTGGAFGCSPPGLGHPGASGGGGAHTPTVGAVGGTSTPGQGNPGGTGVPVAGGGGGGYGGAGTNATPTVGGPGGIGYTWPLNNANYAGGGQGAAPTFTVNPTSPYGGGNGGFPGAPNLAYGTPGTFGTGGGGGGGPSFNPSPTIGYLQGQGGPGTVILAMPTPSYNAAGYTPSPGITVSTAPTSPITTLITFNVTPSGPNTYTYIT